MHPPSKTNWPVVRPLPKFIVASVVVACSVVGYAILWNDRRQAKAPAKVQKAAEVHASVSA